MRMVGWTSSVARAPDRRPGPVDKKLIPLEERAGLYRTERVSRDNLKPLAGNRFGNRDLRGPCRLKPDHRQQKTI